MKPTILALLALTTLSVRAENFPRLSGNIALDLNAVTPAIDTVRAASPVQHRSPALAALLSAILPGAGQAYNEDWWRAAAFFTAEVLGITVSLYYTNAGDKQTTFFQNYADSNVDPTGAGYTAKWDVVKYATWVNGYVKTNSIDSMQITINPDGRLKPWERVNWAQMNTLEREIGDFNASTGFSHTLPPHGDQQYYEEIGKYPQYGHGWDDATDLVSTAFNTPHLLYYSAERGKANNLYTAGTWAVSLVILNHVISAIEAAVSSHNYNKMVQLGFRTESYADGSRGICPNLEFRLGF